MERFPITFYLLDDGTFLVLDPAIEHWFHVPNLLPVVFGYDNYEFLVPEIIDSLKKRAISKCDIGFEFLKDLKTIKLSKQP